MRIIIDNIKNEEIKIKNNLTKTFFLKLTLYFFFFIFINSKTKINNKSKEKIIVNLNIINYINIVINLDDNYIYPCITFLISLLDNRANSSFYIIHILTGNNLRNDTYYKVNTIFEKFAKNYSNVSYYNMGNQFYEATIGEATSTTAAYYRISLPSLLPNVDKCIYMDTDVINLKDLSEMHNIELNDSEYFGGILDYASMINELKSLDINTEKYINTGILLMNLNAIRNNSIEDKIRQYVSSHFLNHLDQTAINAICHNNFKILPLKYSFYASFNSTEELIEYNNEQNEKYRYNESELIQAFYHPVSLHFAGFNKPWQKKYPRTNAAHWWYYAKKSGFYQEILNINGFNREEVENIINKIYKEE